MNEMELWRVQKEVNDNISKQLTCLTKTIEFLLKVVEDHEKDMIKMANKINELNKKLSEEES